MAKPTGYDYHPPIPLPDPGAPEQSLGDCGRFMDAVIAASLRQRSGTDDDKSDGGLVPYLTFTSGLETESDQLAQAQRIDTR
ncbi:hypothetical protein QCA50_013647 [Cerrena zonata]|uniref:Uncharacterized protein n=1 Tax=Cerrena zonata TaxID=2478898 RepID=A0AAW0FQ33_9APHY